MPDRSLLGPLDADARRNLTTVFGRLQAELHENLWQTALRRVVIRPDDLLVLEFLFENLALSGSGVRRLTRRNGARAARLIVRHQPQSMAEEAFKVEPPQPAPHPPFTAKSRLAGLSRVVVEMPAEVSGLDWTLGAFLRAAAEWPLALDWAARPDPRGGFLLTDLDVFKLADQLAGFAQHIQARDRLSDADAASLRRSAARLSAFMQAPARSGRPPPAEEIERVFDSELTRTLAGPRPNRDRAESARQVLAFATAERIVRDVAAVGPTRRRPAWELLEPLLPFLAIPHPPAPSVTALEIPWRVIQTPLATAGFAHATTPVTHEGRTELWHSRLGSRRSAGRVDDDSSEPLRAIWSPDYVAPEDPFLSPTTAEDRVQLVKATAGYDGVPGGLPTPIPGDARRLILTALGAQLDYLGKWRVNGQQPLESWTHHAALGRDYYVRIVKAGFLFPLGHRAVQVELSERKFETPEGGGRVALLRKKLFLIVREPIRSYPSAGMPDGGKGFPFQSVEILTRETPPIGRTPASGPNFWPLLGGDDFLFDCVGVDHAGQRIGFAMPLAFIRIDANGPAHNAFNTLVGPYNSGSARAKRPMNGARIAFAPIGGGADPGDTRLPTETLTFRGVPVSLAADELPDFYPDMASAEVVTGAMQALTGVRRTAVVQIPPIYRTDGFEGSNSGKVYLSAVAEPLTFGGGGAGADKAGGLVTPSLTPGAFSRKFGVVGGAAQTFAQGKFDPSVFFPDAKLLGVLPLRDILHEVVDLATGASQTPKFDQVDLPDRVVTELRISQTNLRAALVFEPDIGGTSQLDILSRTTVMRDGGLTETRVEGSLTNFRINLFGFILLNFDRLRFFAEPGRKPEVDVDLDPTDGVVFGGPLRFVNTLRDVIPGNGFSDPPDLAISPTGITASYSLALPTIQVGVLSLQNVSLGAGFTLPFTGESPTVRFNFAERHNPFNLTVSLFGGGGFFLIGIDADGVREIEAALEFGAQIAIDLGVASGRVYVKAGIYFHWRQTPDKLVELEGYVEMGGELSVLGLISVSLTFHLSLAYRKTTKAEVRGQAELVVEVEVLFFSASVTVRVERSFDGAPGDPPFLQFVPTDDAWRAYSAAFA